MAETGRVWLVGPARVGRGDALLRVWRLDDGVSGGFLVSGRPGRFALGDFHLERDSTTHWYRISDVLRPA